VHKRFFLLSFNGTFKKLLFDFLNSFFVHSKKKLPVIASKHVIISVTEKSVFFRAMLKVGFSLVFECDELCYHTIIYFSINHLKFQKYIFFPLQVYNLENMDTASMRLLNKVPTQCTYFCLFN